VKHGSSRCTPKLLLDVIQRQAGTLAKAMLEGAMNADDARAKHCTMTLNETVLTIEDDGTGFRSREEIETFFEVFGQPHNEKEEKKYGTFRMGRGQLFAFGKNVWRSGDWKMTVDVKTTGLNYVLAKLKQPVKGCRIEVTLYQPLLLVQHAETVREVENLVKWMTLPITLNGKPISKDPAKSKWDHESDNCYLKLTATGDFRAYNLGAFIRSYSGFHFGCGGEVVSKKQLKVNFARNDVMADCPIWQEVKAHVRRQSGQLVRSKPLNDSGRKHLADQFRFGEVDYEAIASKKLLTDVSGRHWTPHEFGNCYRRYNKRLSVTKDGNRLGDKLHQARMAFILGQSTLDRWEMGTVEDLLKLFTGVDVQRWRYKFNSVWTVTPFADLTAGFSNNYRIVPEDTWTLREMAAIALCEAAAGEMLPADWKGREYVGATTQQRRIVIGVSDQAYGWTDGSTYIAIEREWLSHQTLHTVRGLHYLGSLLLHEYCHDSSDMDTHIHSPEFYQLFHDNIHQVAYFVDWSMPRLHRIVASLQRRATKNQINLADEKTRFEKLESHPVLAAAVTMGELKKKKGKRCQKARRESIPSG
jgi:hypothetical protein